VGDEYRHHASVLAQNVWLYVLSIGCSRTPVGHEHGHEHEAKFLWHYIRKGAFWHEVGGQRRVAQARQVCLMDLGEPVRYGNAGPGMAEVWWVCFNGRGMPQMFAALQPDREPIFPLGDTRRVESLFQKLLQITRAKPAAYEPTAGGLLTLLLAELFAVRDPSAGIETDLVDLGTDAGRLSRAVQDSIRYVARHHGGAGLDLKTLSGVSGFSLHYYARLFRRETGLSPIQYLNRYRIEKAKQVLAGSAHPVPDVGRMVGLPNQFQFSHLFRKLTGCAPSEYRKRGSRTKDTRSAPSQKL
jgi:AraC-like DNA-binding protein